MIDTFRLNISGDRLPTPVLLQAAERVAMARVIRLTEAMVRQAAPVRRGRLQRSIQSDVELHGPLLVGRVFTTRFQGRLIESGVRAHTIEPKRKKVLRWRATIATPNGRGKGFWAFAKVVRHPGFVARPFFKPAGDRALQESPAIFQDEIDGTLTRT